jgi:hypothetical protein
MRLGALVRLAHREEKYVCPAMGARSPRRRGRALALGALLSALLFLVAPSGYLEPSSAPGMVQITVSVSLGGSGTGTVTSSPAGINCPGVCSHTFSSADTVTLTATATGGSTFTGWGGDCTGTGSSCVVPSGTINRSISAEFTAPPPAGPTGERTAAVKHCKKKFPKGHKRTRCIKKASRLPV